MQAETTGMTCSNCGKQFRGNPRSQVLGSENYCSIACEEGRREPPMSDPRSAGFHLHLQGDPDDLIGYTLVSDDGVLGQVFAREDGEYKLEYENLETMEVGERSLDTSEVVGKIKDDEIWVE